MNKYITRKTASIEACRFTTKDVRRLNGKPDMDCYKCGNWLDGFSAYIESAYNGRHSTYEAMAAEFNANSKRRFAKSDGTVIGFCRALQEYLSFMCLAVNYGKAYTVTRFNRFLSENYKEVCA